MESLLQGEKVKKMKKMKENSANYFNLGTLYHNNNQLGGGDKIGGGE